MTKTPWHSAFLGGLLIVLLTVAAYLPALRGGFIWDDDDYVTQNQTLRDATGLKRIWLELGATPQYYPLVHTTFWLEHRLWRLNPFGYHAVNVLGHLAAALLLWRVLLRLQLPGAWLAAGLFALHPVQVESVAWITERKNVLSAVFYFAAALAYLRWCNIGEAFGVPPSGGLAGRRWPTKVGTPNKSRSDSSLYYVLALLLFACALLSKTVTCSLPAALLLVVWWQKGRLGWREVWPLLPFFAVGLALGLHTAWLEKHTVGAKGAEWTLSFLERVLIAGRALWFYAGKLLWPAKLTFIYPRWEISAAVWWQWLFPLAALGIVAALWRLRHRIGRGPLVAVLFFAGTLFPALGFINVYPMRYSFVADHFQYHACVGLIVLAAVGLTRLARVRRTWFGVPPSGGKPVESHGISGVKPPEGGTPNRIVLWALPLGLAVLTWQQTHIYRDLETLWRDTIAKNPDCWMAHNNLGLILSGQGNQAAAFTHYQAALRLKPDYPESLNNMGTLLLTQGRTEEAKDFFNRAFRADPSYAEALSNIGIALFKQGRTNEAVVKFQEALKINPASHAALINLGVALSALKRHDEAIESLRTSLRRKPDQPDARINLGSALLEAGRLDEARAEFEAALVFLPDDVRAKKGLAKSLGLQGKHADALALYGQVVRVAPQDAESHYSMGVILSGLGRTDEAMERYRLALKCEPGNAEAHNNLGADLMRKGRGDEAMSHFNEALRLKPDYAEAHNNLAFALAQLGRREEAIAHLREALKFKPDYPVARQQLRDLGVPVD